MCFVQRFAQIGGTLKPVVSATEGDMRSLASLESVFLRRREMTNEEVGAVFYLIGYGVLSPLADT